MPGAIPVGAFFGCDSRLMVGLNNNDPVPQWDDAYSGSARHITQGTGGLQPLYISAAASGFGFPCVRFDGVDDFLQSPAFTMNQGFHIFLVSRLLAFTGDKYVFDGGSDRGGMDYVSTSLMNFQCPSARINMASAAVGKWGVYTGRAAGASSFSRLNGGSQVDGNGGTPDGLSTPFVMGCRTGGTLFGNVDVAALFIYGPGLTDQQVRGMDVYLTSSFGTADLVGAANVPIFGALPNRDQKTRDPRLRLAESLGVNARTLKDAADFVERQRHAPDPEVPVPVIRRSPEPIPDSRKLLDSDELWADRAWPEPGE